MRIAVIVEQIWDPASVEPDPLTGAIDMSRVVAILSPSSRTALELALRLATGGQPSGAHTADAYCAGPHAADAALRECLALGAKHITRVWDTLLADADTLSLARALAAVLHPEAYDLLLLGNRGPDQGPNALGPLLADVLALPQVTSVEALTPGEDGRTARVRSRLDRGVREELEVELPAVVAIEPGVIEPLSASLPAVLAAQQAAIPVVRPPRPSESPAPRLLGTHPPRPRPHRAAIAPDEEAPVAERLAAILGTGKASSTSTLFDGPPDEAVERILALLAERHYL